MISLLYFVSVLNYTVILVNEFYIHGIHSNWWWCISFLYIFRIAWTIFYLAFLHVCSWVISAYNFFIFSCIIISNVWSKIKTASYNELRNVLLFIYPESLCEIGFLSFLHVDTVPRKSQLGLPFSSGEGLHSQTPPRSQLQDYFHQHFQTFT